jgi:hypothetical protein
MFKPFAISPIVRNVAACGLLTFALAACGSNNGSASGVIANTADTAGTTSLVSPNTGYIDRTGAMTGNTDGTSSVASTSAPTTEAATPVANSNSNASSTTVASTNKTSTGGNSGVSGSAPKASTGVATLDWTAPTENSDGSVLTNLAGYTVYYGTSPSNLTQTVKISNPGLTAYTMTDLPAGTWYFTITAYTADGTESTRSGVVSTKI